MNNYYYYPFGDSLNYSGTLKNDLQFTGKSNISGMDAYDFSARYYDPAIGRFYSIDPLFNPATSPYAYCDNDPVNKTDPTGMTPKNNNYKDGRPTGNKLANNGRESSGSRMDRMAYLSSLTHQPNIIMTRFPAL